MTRIFDEPLIAPSGFLSPEDWESRRAESQNLEAAKEVVNRFLCNGSDQLSFEARRILRSVWAYLHECFCAGGVRPNRRRVYEFCDQAFDDYHYEAPLVVPKERKWARVRGVTVTA